MPRRSLRPELNRIRAWVRQGRTDAWIAHQLEVTVQQIQAFKREHDLDEGSQTNGENAAADFDDEIDLRAEDDALIAAELEAAEGPPKRMRAQRPTPIPIPRRSPDSEGRGRGPPEPPSPQPPRRAPARTLEDLAARGDVRPRRRGLRPVARSRAPGRPDLCRVLGWPPPRGGHGRGGPDRDPPRRRGTPTSPSKAPLVLFGDRQLRTVVGRLAREAGQTPLRRPWPCPTRRGWREPRASPGRTPSRCSASRTARQARRW